MAHPGLHVGEAGQHAGAIGACAGVPRVLGAKGGQDGHGPPVLVGGPGELVGLHEQVADPDVAAHEIGASQHVLGIGRGEGLPQGQRLAESREGTLRVSRLDEHVADLVEDHGERSSRRGVVGVFVDQGLDERAGALEARQGFRVAPQGRVAPCRPSTGRRTR